MAILSAGINFGKPATEFIVESDESGVIQSCRNVVTGVEYAGGGGGGGDFTTAEVTILNNSSTLAGNLMCAICDDDTEMSNYLAPTSESDPNVLVKVILYKGKANYIINIANITDNNITLSGDIEPSFFGKQIGTIIGDGIITIHD